MEAILNSLAINGGDDEVDASLVVGIDFGTTYSGVAWATKHEIEKTQINFITSWPGIGGEEGKVPTELFYDDDDDEPSWGYEVSADQEPFRWFKLLLLRTEDLDPEVRNSTFVVRVQQMMEESNRTAIGLVTDYLRLLWAHIVSTIERARGEEVVEALTFHIVITVPAIWKSYARQAMENAAKNAGLLDQRTAGDTTLSFAPEPESAALSTLLEQGSGVRPGNVYVICDAGGGTVDLVSYEVQKTKPLALKEAVEGSGGLCGGIFIDQAFEHLCSGRLGAKWKRLSQTGIKEIMKKEWEYGIKPQFRPAKAKKHYIVSLPAETFMNKRAAGLDDTTREPHIKNGRIHFRSSDIRKAFDDLFVDIESLIAEQIRKAEHKGLSVTGIILVGGLGSSPYLYDYLKTAYLQAGITVLQSGGLKPCNRLRHQDVQAPVMVTSTISRASYGTVFSALFEDSLHLMENRYWCEKRQEWRTNGQMSWYLKRGESVIRSKPIQHFWSRLYYESEYDGSLVVSLYQCEDQAPPSTKTSSVQRFATLRCNLDVAFSDLPVYALREAGVVRTLTFMIELVPSGAAVELNVYMEGRKQGGKSVNVLFN